MTRVITVTSASVVWARRDDGQPGHRPARLRQRVVIIDTDIGLHNLDVVMGLQNRSSGVIDLVEGGVGCGRRSSATERWRTLLAAGGAEP